MQPQHVSHAQVPVVPLSSRLQDGRTELKPAIVFVHGFLEPEATWEPLINLLRRDPEVAPHFDFVCFGYSTKAVEVKPHQRIPGIGEAAKALREFLDSKEFYDREITLVGHSQGGLVIQAYLADMLKHGQGESLSPIRQVITMATPSLGSTFLSPWRKLVGKFFSNPQEQALRVLDPYTSETLNFIAQHVVHAKKCTNNQWPIPFHVFYGIQDNIVLEASARGVFPDENLTPLEADHFTILRPSHRQDRRYTEFVEALLDPSGHSSVYEVELYETKVSVRPALDKQEFVCKHGETTRIVHSDNIGCIDRSVVFSRKNRCTEPLFENPLPDASRGISRAVYLSGCERGSRIRDRRVRRLWRGHDLQVHAEAWYEVPVQDRRLRRLWGRAARCPFPHRQEQLFEEESLHARSERLPCRELQDLAHPFAALSCARSRRPWSMQNQSLGGGRRAHLCRREGNLAMGVRSCQAGSRGYHLGPEGP